MATLDEYLNGLQQRQQKVDLLEANLTGAANTNPDEFASMVKLSRAAQISVEAIPDYKEMAKATSLLTQADVPTLIESSPKTAQFLSNPEKANMASDDIDNFKQTEGVFGAIGDAFKYAGGVIKSGAFGASADLVGVVRSPVEMLNELSGKVLPEKPFTPLAQALEEYQKSISRRAAAERPQAEGILKRGFLSGAESLTRNIFSVPLLFAGPAGQRAYLTSMIAPVVGQEYEKAREKGLDPFQSTLYGVSQGAVEYATEKLPLTKLIGDLKVGSPFYKILGKQLAYEIPGEQLATVVQDLNEWAVLNPDKPFKSYLEERPSAAAETLIATIVSTGGQTTLIRAGEAVMNTFGAQDEAANRANVTADMIADINKLANASKVRSRDAESFREWIEQVSEDSPVQNVYIAADVLKQSGMSQQLKEVAPELADQIDAAERLGREVEIPIADYMTKIAPTSIGDALLDDLRAEGETMTRREATQFIEKRSEELQSAMDQVMKTQELEESFIKSAREVETTVYDQIKATGVYTDAASRSYASFVRDFYVTRAAEVKNDDGSQMTPRQLYDLMPYQVTREMPDVQIPAGGILSQEQLDQFAATPEFKSWFGESKIVDEQGKPMVLYHGTADDVTQFDLDNPNRKDSGWLGTGVYLTDSVDAAELYAGQKKRTGAAAPNVMPLYARLENPYYATAEDKARVRAGGREAADQFTADLQAQGYDGVIYQVSPDAKEMVVFNPAAVKSQFNDGTWSDAANLLSQGGIVQTDDGQVSTGRPIFDDIITTLGLTDEELNATAIEYMTGLPGNQAFVTPSVGKLKDVVAFLQERRLDSGLPVLDITKEEDRKQLAKLVAAEALAHIRNAGNSLEWYDQTVAKTVAMMAVKYPELGQDPNAKTAFLLSTAIASQGLNPEDNLVFASNQYAAFRQDGKFPVVGQGDSASAMANNYRKANELLEELGPDLMRRFLATPFTVRELENAGFPVGGENKDTVVLGSAIFGPKIGFGFYSNLNGNFEPVTMDMWFMRTVGRLAGTLPAFEPNKFAKQVDRFRKALTERGAKSKGLYASQFDKDLVQAAKTDDGKLIELAGLVKKAHEKDFKNNRKLFDSKKRIKTELVAAADTILISLEKPKDVPSSGTERNLLRDVMSQVVDIVEANYGSRVPPAAVQALIWYPEQELYKAMGVGLRVTSQDYAGSARKLLEREGYDGQQLDFAAELGSRLVRPEDAGSIAGAISGDDQGAGRARPLEADERTQFLIERNRKILEERALAKINFEVAPDPNNQELVERWRQLTPEQRLNISFRVAQQVVPKLLKQLKFKGAIQEQTGSYLDDTNPSFAIRLDSGDVETLSKTLGFVLSQDSMMAIAAAEFPGSTQSSALRIDIGDKTTAEIEQIYNTLRSIVVDGAQPIGGQSTSGGVMTILLDQGADVEVMSTLVNNALNNEYTITVHDVYSAFPEKQEYDYADQESDPPGDEGLARQRARDARAEATRLLASELDNVAGTGGVLYQSGAGGVQRLRASDLNIGVRYGTARDGSTSVAGIHYSGQPRTNLAGGYYGTGLKGAESARLGQSDDARIKRRIHFYVDEGAGIQPEAGVGGHVHGVNLDNIYDASADPLGLKAQALASGLDEQGIWFNNLESAILDAGFDGVYIPGAQGNQGVAVLLGDHAVQVEQKGTHQMQAAGAAEPPPTGKRRYSLLGSEIRKFEAQRAEIEAAAPSVQLQNGNLIFDEADTAAVAEFFPPAAKAAQLRQEARGGFDPTRLTTILNEQSDYSTFLHETAHFFMTATFRMAEMPGATQQMKDDVQTILDWFGVKDLATWNALSLEEQRKYHERWAYNYEIYVFEGKAPSVKVQTLFDKFGAWLRRVYKSIRDELNVIYRQENGEDLPIMTGEVRQVMDRMLASEEQIKQAETVRNMVPLYQTQAESGMDDATWAAYQNLMQEATDASIAALTTDSVRQMRWLANAKSRLLKEKQRETREVRKEVRAQVAKEVEQEPLFRAMRLIKFGEERMPDGTFLKVDENTKLSIAGMEELYMGDGDRYALLDWSSLGYGKYGMLSEDGMHPDVLAERTGFSSGDELVRALIGAPSLKDTIESRTDQRMLEEYSDLSDPRAVELAVERALHNEARARFVAAELRHAAKATAPVRVMIEAAKQAARRIIGNKLVRDTKASEYSAAETRAMRQAEKAMKTGDADGVTRALQNRLLNNQLTAEAATATQEIDKGLRYLRKVLDDKNRKRMGADYADQIEMLLERFELRPITLREVDRRTTLAQWIEQQRAAGYEPEISEVLESEATRKSYKNMTVQEFRDLIDAVSQIEHLGRTEQNMLTAAKQVAYQEARDEIVASINENARGRVADARTPTTNLGRYAQSLKRFWASHIKAATVARILDGGKDGGPMWEYFVRSANERGDMETQMRAEATETLTKIMAPVFAAGKMGGKGKFFPTLGRSLNKESVMAIALNMGNEGNIQRLLGGESWTMEQVMPVLNSLTPGELMTVQKIWDYFESFRPQIAEKERRLYGKEPKWVEPRPLEVVAANGETVNLRGGYYPIKYDPVASIRAESHSDAEEAKRMLQGAYTSATTRRSFTKSRVEAVKGRPLLYTLSGMYSGINDVIHDLAWHEWLIDANKLMKSQSIDEAIRSQYGPEFKEQLKTWVNDVAVGERMANNSGEIALNRLRQGISAAGLGFNVMSALQQITGFNQSIVRVGAGYIGRGVAKVLSSPVLAIQEVNSKSSFMANRARTQFRELNELRNMVQDESKVMRTVKTGAYFMMARMQRLVDTPTWLGAYEKAIGEGNDENRAIALADQAVIDSQGNGMMKDLSAIERGGPALKLFTVYYSYMNTVFNLTAAQTMTAQSKGKLAADYLMLFIVPVVLTTALKSAFTPGGDDEWDWEEIARKLGAEQLSYLMGTMIVVRELGEAAKVVTGAEGGARDYSGPAGLRAISDAYKFLKQASQFEFDDAFRKSAINLLGDLTGLPSAQVNRTITGVKALVEGETQNPAAAILGFQPK